MLIHILRRAKELTREGKELFASPSLQYFLKNDIGVEEFKNNPDTLNHFAQLDDFDLFGAIKVWQHDEDAVLSELSDRLVNRDLFKIEISDHPFSTERIDKLRKKICNKLQITNEEGTYFVYANTLSNNAYNDSRENINLLRKNGEVIDVSKASDNLNISALSSPVQKYFLSYPVFRDHQPKQLTMIKDVQ